MNVKNYTSGIPVESDVHIGLRVKQIMCYLAQLEAHFIKSMDGDSSKAVMKSAAALRPVGSKYGWGESVPIARKRISPIGAAQKADPNALYVIHRWPIARGAVALSAKQHRYAGNPGGWTPDPNKVTPFDSEDTALERCKSGDAVETLAQAQRRFRA